MKAHNNRYEESFSTWNKVALLYQEKFMHLDIYNETYLEFCNLITVEKPTIFEIGCGPGNISRYLNSIRPDLRICGIDRSGNMVELANKNVVNADFQVMDARNLKEIGTKYNGIVVGFLIPYISGDELTILIENCYRILHSEGILYLSYVPGNQNKSGFISRPDGNRVYFYYHNEADLLKNLSENKFEIISVSNIDYLKNEDQELHSVIIAKKV